MRPLFAALVLFALSGCGDDIWWTYRDEPYLAGALAGDESDVLRKVNSLGREQRQIALRSVAHMAAKARGEGRAEDADRLEAVILRRYFVEKEPEVRACVVLLCAPAAGRGSARMVAFLRDRIAAGEYPGYAALSLAALAPRDAWADIEPLTRHPAPEVRLQAATALTVLRDPRGYEAVRRVWKGMDAGGWPDRVEGVPLSEARTGLEMRAQRAFGRPLH